MMGYIKRQIDTGIPSSKEDNPQRKGKEHVLKYAKFLKEMMARHKKIKVGEQVTLNASCNVIISRHIFWYLIVKKIVRYRSY
ncbi:hypothetical protein EPI10_015805 [Gossypium australe]|uniref:Uncharacterized protein n=1 Tax=Gossypium australe TaxID=47621 RepID=A0A5B6VLZ4_9ROSI|nr:hypothetical protein EPI10_015805 [Gossypium australe]